MSLIRYNSNTKSYTIIQKDVFSKHIYKVLNTSTKNYEILYLNNKIISYSKSEDKYVKYYDDMVWFILDIFYILIFLFIISYFYNFINIEDSNIIEVSLYEEFY